MPPVSERRTCPSCGGKCAWHDEAWVCDRCGDEFYELSPDPPREFRKPNVCVTDAEAEWLREAAKILKGESASDAVRRKAATYVAKVAADAVRANAR